MMQLGRNDKIMTKEEAYFAMKEGYKVTNKYFSKEEYLYMKDGHIFSEEGYSFDDWFFNPKLNEGWKETGWKIFA